MWFLWTHICHMKQLLTLQVKGIVVTSCLNRLSYQRVCERRCSQDPLQFCSRMHGAGHRQQWNSWGQSIGTVTVKCGSTYRLLPAHIPILGRMPLYSCALEEVLNKRGPGYVLMRWWGDWRKGTYWVGWGLKVEGISGGGGCQILIKGSEGSSALNTMILS